MHANVQTRWDLDDRYVIEFDSMGATPEEFRNIVGEATFGEIPTWGTVIVEGKGVQPGWAYRILREEVDAAWEGSGHKSRLVFYLEDRDAYIVVASHDESEVGTYWPGPRDMPTDEEIDLAEWLEDFERSFPEAFPWSENLD